MLGNGIYFAKDASYSSRDTYSPPDAQGNKNMYQTRVLTGEYCKGKKGMKSPPVKTPPAVLYNSVVDSVKSPQVFVVFSETQAYPEYLVTFQ